MLFMCACVCHCSLEVLVLVENNISEFPKEFSKLTKLHTLW